MRNTAVKMVTRSTFFHGGHYYVVIEVSSGAIEIYSDESGIETFKGYIQDLCIPGSLRLAACEALYKYPEHRTFHRPTQLELA